MIDDEGDVDECERRDTKDRFERDDRDGTTTESRARTECEKSDRHYRNENAKQCERMAGDLANPSACCGNCNQNERESRPIPPPNLRYVSDSRARMRHLGIVPLQSKLKRGERPMRG